MTRIRSMWLVCAFVVVGVLARVGGASPVVIGLDTSTGHLLMEAWIEGEGPYWFVLDTGNQQTTVFAHVARTCSLETEPMGEMGGAGSGTLQVHSASDVRVGIGVDGEELEFVDPMVTVLPDEAQLPDFNGKEIAGFLGASLIQRFMTTIDYGESELVLEEREGYEIPEGARVLEMEMESGFPYFSGSITAMGMGEDLDPVEGNYLLDLGATPALQLEFEAAQEIGLVGLDDPAQRMVGMAQGIDGVPFEIRSAPISASSMGGLDLDEAEIVFSTSPGGGPPIEDLRGAVGSGLFDGDRITLDYEGRRLIWVVRD